MTPPAIHAFTPGTNYYDMTQSTTNVYTISNFANSNSKCAISTLVVQAASPVSALYDMYKTTGNIATTAVSLNSAPAASSISVTIPAIDTVEHYYYFRMFATVAGVAQATPYSDNILIRLVNCAYTVLSLPTPYYTPQAYLVLDVTDTTGLL